GRRRQRHRLEVRAQLLDGDAHRGPPLDEQDLPELLELRARNAHDYAQRFSSGRTSAAKRRMLASACSYGIPPKRKHVESSNEPMSSRRAASAARISSGVPNATAFRKLFRK